MQYLYSKKIIVVLLYLLSVVMCSAQSDILSVQERKKISLGLGIGLGYNIIDIDKSVAFIETDTIIEINPLGTIGLTTQFIANFNVHPSWTVRVSCPNFNYAEYAINYKKKDNKSLSFTFDNYRLSIPLEILYKSDMVNKSKFYVSGGGYCSYNFTTNIDSKNVRFLKLSKYDYGFIIGLGLMLSGELTVTAFEFKYQYGFANMFIKNPDYIFSNNIETLHSQSFIFSVNFF